MPWPMGSYAIGLRVVCHGIGSVCHDMAVAGMPVCASPLLAAARSFSQDSAMRLPPAAGSRRACHTPFFFFLLILLSHIQ
mgnify:CR=1 FL=1